MKKTQEEDEVQKQMKKEEEVSSSTLRILRSMSSTVSDRFILN